MELISLNGDWQFESESDKEWMKAKVPGDVHLDLLENKVIEDPLYGDNAEKCKWIEEKMWIYKKTFLLQRDSKRTELNLYSKDWTWMQKFFSMELK